MNLCSIASGSSGNCIYVGSHKTHLLVDAGISGKRIEGGLSELDVNPKNLDGILITHEHMDHVLGLGIMARRYQIPIYSTRETIEAIKNIKSLGKIAEELFHEIKPDETFSVKEIQIHPFAISHDAANPVCFTFSSQGHKIGFATDLGTYDDYIISNLCGVEILFIEANHDINMLQVGSYPYPLKRRILGERGHLSNDNSGRLINHLLSEKLKYIFLGHLSKENNYPELAYETVQYELSKEKNPWKERCKIFVASREKPSMMVSI